MRRSACRICETEALERVLHYDRAPRNIERLLDSPEASGDDPVELNVYLCQTCGHVQLLDELEGDYYDDYLMTHSHAQKMFEFQKEQAATFVGRFELRGRRVFEAGCGDGQFCTILKDLGCDALANEPSTKARNAIERRGLRVVDGHVGRGSHPDLAGRFDAFVARQVLEHVPRPNDFLQGARELLATGGVLLVEIPSLEQAIEQDRFFDFFPDHLSYFSAASLVHLFARNLLEIVQIRRAMDGEYNEVWARKTDHPGLAGVRNAAASIAGAFRQFLDAERSAGRRVAIWGAGAKGVLTLSMVDTRSVAYLVDLDPVKRDKFTPVSHLQVSSPDRLLAEPVDTVIITALAYKDEITRDLRTRYGFRGSIACLSGGRVLAES